MMFYALFDFVGDGIANFFRDIMWQLIYAMIKFINELLNALCNGIITFPIIDNIWVTKGYQACLVLMIVIFPAKLCWEFVYAVFTDDDNLDIFKKLISGLMGIAIAVSLGTIIPMVNNLSINASNILVNLDYANGENIESANKDFSKNLVVSVLCSFGGMEKNNRTFSYVTNGKNETMDLGASRFYDYVINPDNALEGYEGEPSEAKTRTDNNFFSKGKYNRWSFYYRFDTDGGGLDGSDDFDLLGEFSNDSDYPESVEQGTDKAYGNRSIPTNKSQATKAYNYICSHSGEYMWDFGYFGTMIGLIIFVILLFYISTEIAMRILMIGFWYIIGPLCCLSLTNQKNPQAFVVWKNSIMGAFILNFTQLFLLQFLMNISDDIMKIGSSISIIAGLILYFASLSLVISVPPFVQSMIGGYGAGFLESLNQMKGIWGTTGGLAVSGTKAVFGRKNESTGHLSGGIRGKIMGNKDANGNRIGGIKNNAKQSANKIASATLGKKDANGNRSGGLMGAIMKDSSAPSGGKTERKPISSQIQSKINDTGSENYSNFSGADGYNDSNITNRPINTSNISSGNSKTSTNKTTKTSRQTSSMSNLFNNKRGGKK